MRLTQGVPRTKSQSHELTDVAATATNTSLALGTGFATSSCLMTQGSPYWLYTAAFIWPKGGCANGVQKGSSHSTRSVKMHDSCVDGWIPYNTAAMSQKTHKHQNRKPGNEAAAHSASTRFNSKCPLGPSLFVPSNIWSDPLHLWCASPLLCPLGVVPLCRMLRVIGCGALSRK